MTKYEGIIKIYSVYSVRSGSLKNASKLSLSQSHTMVRSLGDTGSRSKSAIHLNIDLRSRAMCLYMYTNQHKGEILTLRFCSAIKILLRSLWSTPNEADATTQQLFCCKEPRYNLWGRQLKFQGLTKQEWVIRVGPDFFVFNFGPGPGCSKAG